MPFPPGCYYQGGQFHRFRDLSHVTAVCRDDEDTACQKIHQKLVAGVEKRLVSDAKVGFLLSGGLDSSLVCAIAARKSKTPIRTFAIGMEGDAIDLKYARQVADFIGSHHTEVFMTPKEVIDSLEEVIQLLGTYDITTIRASMGMYLVCKYIHQHTDIRVLLTGRSPTNSLAISTQTLPPARKPFKRSPKSVCGSCICTMCSGQTGASPSTPWRPGCLLEI